MNEQQEIKKITTSSDSNTKGNKARNYIIYGAMIGSVMCCSSLAYAAFDIGRGLGASIDPIVNVAKAHWGKGIAISGILTALLSEGDMRTRAIKAGIGCASGGAVILGIIAAVGG